jgi:hypothetical protein
MEIPAPMQRPMFHPEPARTIEVAGIPRSMIFDLALKRTFLEGATNLSRLIGETKLDYNVIYDGILVIDDFGRQRIHPRHLLNRWIVPSDRHVDYISWFGTSIEIPFELIVVFATNLNLASLAEEAFIRRIKNKIKIDRIGDEIFLEILCRQCAQRGIEYDPGVAAHAVLKCLDHSKEGLRACYPRDLLDIVCGIAAFQQRLPRFDHDDVDRAIDIYFVQ